MRLKTKRLLFIIPASAVILLASAAAYTIYMPNFKPSGTSYIYIDDNKDFNALCRVLRDSAGCANMTTFELFARLRRYPANMKPGRYAIERGMSNKDLLDRLRRGQQSPVHLTFNNIRFKADLANRIADQLMFDGEDLLVYLNDEDYCNSLGFDTETIGTIFIPNTYDVYWNTTPVKLIERMKREYDAFWTDKRLEKAQAANLSPVAVSIIASIVEEETADVSEYPVVAGLYINRLHKNMLLQADPTVKYAVGDFSLKRILNYHLRTESPYNTYLHEGLPPGPIRIPSPAAIDATLNYTNHNYLYMCAKEDFSGRHNFSASLSEHNRNAAKWHAELNRRGIR